jgi:hypothetical protein
MPWVRKALLIQRPESAPGTVRTVFRAIGAAFGAIVVFCRSLVG